MKIATVLEAGRKVLEDHELAQKFYAYDKDGNYVGEDSAEAVCFCTLGALFRGVHNLKEEGLVTSENEFYAITYAQYELENLIEVENELGIISIPTWNDTEGRTKAEVLDLFDRAIINAGDKEIES